MSSGGECLIFFFSDDENSAYVVLKKYIGICQLQSRKFCKTVYCCVFRYRVFKSLAQQDFSTLKKQSCNSISSTQFIYINAIEYRKERQETNDLLLMNHKMLRCLKVTLFIPPRHLCCYQYQLCYKRFCLRNIYRRKIV